MEHRNRLCYNKLMFQDKNTIIFDFDGTVGDTIPFIYKVANELAVEYGFEQVTKEEFDTLRNKSPFEIIAQLKISLWKIPFILHKGRALLKRHMRNAPYIEGIRDVLLKLKLQGYVLGMLTSNSQENIDIFLKKNDLYTFDFIYTENNIFGKQFSLRNIIQKRKLDMAKTIYVGDEVRDIEACQTVGLDIISVTWGFNAKKLLQKYNPTYIADKPEELLLLLKKGADSSS